MIDDETMLRGTAEANAGKLDEPRT